MKRLKLILMVFVAVLASFVGGKALAYDITINGAVDGHTYEAYQIFKGDLSDKTLSNITWGNGVTLEGTAELGNAKEKAELLTDTAKAEEFAKKVGKYLRTPTKATVSKINVNEAGYYLIKDEDASLDGKNKGYTAYILEVVKDVTVKPKADVPTVQKKVKDTDDTTGVTSNWQDSADHDIDDNVPFQLTATLPSNFDSFNQYYLNFSDTLSAGLDYNNDAKVFVENAGVRIDVSNYFFKGMDNGTLSFAIVDLKQIALDGVATVNKDTKVIVEYTAKLNKKAVHGSDGNPNEVVLVYYNNPNKSGDGKNKPNTPPGTPPNTPPTPPTPPTGKTPKDKVIVFTYKTVVNKVDGKSKEKLPGAEFTLFKKLKDGSEKEIKSVKAEEGTQFAFNGLDDGEYILRETKAPAGYNKVDDITFTIVATHDETADEPKLTDLNVNAVSGEITFTPNVDAGSLTTKVENNKGSILPSTGSTGTTILYVVGAILAIGAGVLLVTKKRMDA